MATKYETFEDELDAIRLAIYEEIKDMTTEERVAYIRAQAAPVIQQYGLKTMNLEQMKVKQQTEREAVLS